MGQKDFSGWNGEKIKSVVRPQKEKLTRGFVKPRKHKAVGFKTRVDRFRAELEELATAWNYRKLGLIDRVTNGKQSNQRRHGDWWITFHTNSIRRSVVDLRKMKKELQSLGLLVTILHLFRDYKFRNHSRY